LEKGQVGEVYNLGYGAERPNREVIDGIVELTGCDPSLVKRVPDRPGHDRRYALQTEKARALGWEPRTTFRDGLAKTVKWYRDHPEWWEPLKGESFHEYYKAQYDERLAQSAP
ncbi:MAG TPA: dTDP-glucose 4,6-dehydratase, partial [Chloroflexota bacterium]